jgi:hypothetical protein
VRNPPEAPTFDPSRSVSFDLERGHVEMSDGDPHLLVPASALLAIVAGESDARGLGRHMGVALVGRVAARIAKTTGVTGDAVRELMRRISLEAMVELLGGELALLGLGNLRVERWGKAMLFVLDPCALDARGDLIFAGILEGALTSVAQREVAAVVVDRSGQNARALVGNISAMAKAEALVHRGVFFTEIVSALHEGGRDEG